MSKVTKVLRAYATRVVVQLADGKTGHTSKMDANIGDELTDFTPVNETAKSVGSVLAAIKSGDVAWRTRAIAENREAAAAIREGAELAALLGL